jgi:hypothetical protein
MVEKFRSCSMELKSTGLKDSATLLKSKGFQPIPLELYVESMSKFFQGPFMPENLCEKTLQFDNSNCEKFVNFEE